MLGATVTAVSAGIPGTVTVTGAGAGVDVRGPAVATTVRVGGAESVATLRGLAGPDDEGGRRGGGEHAGDGQGHPLPPGRARPASVVGHSQRLGTDGAGTDTPRACVAMLLPQLDALFADRERLPVTGLPGVH